MPNAGDVIAGKYELLEPLGSAARGTVWKALHKTLESPVVIKFVQAAGAADAKSRFIREAKAAAAIRHHNVVDIIDFGTTDAGDPYMVLEHLSGETLEERLARDPPMSTGEGVHIVLLSLTGLAAVHEAGFVHRDLNPRNVFLVHDAEEIYPKLLDFGVSKAVDHDSGQGLTLDGMVLGVPEYVSPEQAQGLRDIDARADVYSIGVILFQLLVGHRPFDPIERQKVLVQKITTDPPTVASLRPELGGALSDVVARALAKDRADRFPDARSMRQALLDAEIDPAVRRQPGPAQGSLLLRPARAPEPEPAPSAPSPIAPPPIAGASRAQGTRSRARLTRTIVLLVLLGAASVYAIELWRPGTILPAPAPPPGAEGVIEVVDAGVLPPADAGPIEMVELTVRSVPDGATMTIDGVALDAAAVDARRRRPRTTVVMEVPRRAGPFEIEVWAPGFRPWSVRRWALRDVQVSARLTPE